MCQYNNLKLQPPSLPKVSFLRLRGEGPKHETELVACTLLTSFNRFYLIQVLVSGDESGLINIWTLKDRGLKHLRSIDPFGEFPVTCLSVWNKIWHGKSG